MGRVRLPLNGGHGRAENHALPSGLLDGLGFVCVGVPCAVGAGGGAHLTVGGGRAELRDRLQKPLHGVHC